MIHKTFSYVTDVDNPGGRKTQTDISSLKNKSTNDLKSGSTLRNTTLKNVTQLQFTQVMDKKSVSICFLLYVLVM